MRFDISFKPPCPGLIVRGKKKSQNKSIYILIYSCTFPSFFGMTLFPIQSYATPLDTGQRFCY